MMTWTLYLLLVLPTGEYGATAYKEFTQKGDCERAAASITASPPPEVKRIIAVCKEKINV
jgi:hypothetical protein